MIKRIGMLTSGGDCQALNATMRGVVKGLSNNLDELEVYGFDDGYKGLIYGKYRMLTVKRIDFMKILFFQIRLKPFLSVFDFIDVFGEAEKKFA